MYSVFSHQYLFSFQSLSLHFHHCLSSSVFRSISYKCFFLIFQSLSLYSHHCLSFSVSISFLSSQFRNLVWISWVFQYTLFLEFVSHSSLPHFFSMHFFFQLWNSVWISWVLQSVSFSVPHFYFLQSTISIVSQFFIFVLFLRFWATGFSRSLSFLQSFFVSVSISIS
jgi:hypothetical protein